MALDIIRRPTPAAGAWYRCRALPHQLDRGGRTERAWRGSWHRATGDLRYSRRGPLIVAACGATAPLWTATDWLGEPVRDVVVVDERPGVDACRTCSREARRIPR